MRRITAGFVIASVALGVLTACGGSQRGVTPEALVAAPGAAPLTKGFKFKRIVNPQDSTFNRVLGINDARVAVGYDGRGDAGHPNAGYSVVPPFEKHDFTAENFPGAAQTRVTAIDNRGDTAGTWTDGAGSVHGFIEWNGTFTSYDDPGANNDTEILGLNDSGIAAGFYTGASGARHGFVLDRSTGTFTEVTPPGATNVTVAGINAHGDLVGYYSSGSQTVGFLGVKGSYSTLTYPGADATVALGINARGTIVGGYTNASGDSHGFVLRSALRNARWQSIDHPLAVGTTTINGVNDRLNMVGWYVDAAGNTIGMLAERKKM